MEEMNVFIYLRVELLMSGSVRDDVNLGSDEGKKVGSTLRHMQR